MRFHENPWECRLHVGKDLATIGSPDGLLSILETDNFFAGLSLQNNWLDHLYGIWNRISKMAAIWQL